VCFAPHPVSPAILAPPFLNSNLRFIRSVEGFKPALPLLHGPSSRRLFPQFSYPTNKLFYPSDRYPGDQKASPHFNGNRAQPIWLLSLFPVSPSFTRGVFGPSYCRKAPPPPPHVCSGSAPLCPQSLRNCILPTPPRCPLPSALYAPPSPAHISVAPLGSPTRSQRVVVAEVAFSRSHSLYFLPLTPVHDLLTLIHGSNPSNTR
jgi:hypothetical protein